MKVGIIGAGFVGATAAFAMAMRGSCSEIVIVDADNAKAKAQASDIEHAVPFSFAMTVRDGDFQDLKGAKVIIISAGVNQKPGETRLQLLERNANIFRDIVPKVVAIESNAVIVVATNPVDILTSLTEQLAGLPEGQVMGSGTTLDTARFRALIGNELGVDPQHVHAYVIGEHGDSEVFAWSSANVAGLSIPSFCKARQVRWNEEIQSQIADNVRKAAYHIIEGKGATYYGIGAVLARISEALIRNHRAVLTVSANIPEFGVALSLPRLVSGKGIDGLIGVQTNDEERAALERSASVLREALSAIS
ncbi:L-lactate dehydrogenase [Chloroherpeton thalassium ATCC 35110]|uniref:L-lactate dehydrogenase n=1 Tax=Chloroherpeton thalassium (strain ATCC 35110 / GB-78) TaxID=517418 RepID=LDH_CHLT3|nr:L-lactate dehydrogenase [Chloroherpeton thalassium]B3QX21.1 RecName: Full=L-lactate dehydrogenase; Short=L-LDH [Chloroherpeton thalassium ATCC 35110]ACF14831.1 L-lactate dehydrogenase [Chloroherpeton thalassium ATCC 35110]